MQSPPTNSGRRRARERVGEGEKTILKGERKNEWKRAKSLQFRIDSQDKKEEREGRKSPSKQTAGIHTVFKGPKDGKGK